MNCGHVFQSITPWKKLAAIQMKPKLAYKILKYVKKVFAENDVIEKQRINMVYEITGTAPGADAKIEPNTPEFETYFKRLNEILAVEIGLEKIDLKFEDVIESVDEKDESLSVSDLATLEEFFVSDDPKCPCPPDDDCCDKVEQPACSGDGPVCPPDEKEDCPDDGCDCDK